MHVSTYTYNIYMHINLYNMYINREREKKGNQCFIQNYKEII